MRKISRKSLIVLSSVLFVTLTAETYYFRRQIKDTIIYYRNKFVNIKKSNDKINEFINCEIRPNSVIIFEHNRWHLECLPGYAKYFTELGYNVDVLIAENLEDSMEKFSPSDKLRIFTFVDEKDILNSADRISDKFKKYEYSMLHSTDIYKKDLFYKLGYLENPKSLFVAHDLDVVKGVGLEKFNDIGHVIGLADYGKLNYVNPNYFGEFSVSPKNDVTTFFVTSTSCRNYLPLLQAVQNMKKLGLKFKINVTGHSTTFSSDSVPGSLQEYFNFYGKVSYRDMYSIISESDYIFIPFDPESGADNLFRTSRATGSVQISYGFLKPVIIEENFSDTYKLTDDSCITYNSENLTDVMIKAINMSKEKYSVMQGHIKTLRDEIFEMSKHNLEKALSNNSIA